MSISTEAKLKRRKLDALRRGVHRIGSGQAAPVSTHIIGIGRAGAGVIAAILRSLAPDAPKLFALAIDIGGQDQDVLRALAAATPPDRADVTIVALPMPTPAALSGALDRYPEFLTLEYPRAQGGTGHVPWLDPAAALPAAGEPVSRAVAKAVYGAAYYAGPRLMERTLRSFADKVDAASAQPVVAVVFGLGGGAGSGIAVDLARHLSNRIFGRRALVAGVGIAPCGGDPAAHRGGRLFAVLNELDCLGDEAKNHGIVAPCGDLFRNPFTAGFFLVPQEHVWAAMGDLAATRRRVDQEIAALLAGRGGANLLEAMRMLNWVAAPSTQHSAARTPWGERWIHMLGFADTAGAPVAVGPDLPARLGLLPGYAPEFIEVRVPEAASAGAGPAAGQIEAAFRPDVPPQLVDGGRDGSVQFILPCIAKTELAAFHAARAAYDRENAAQRLAAHSLLLEHGVVLSEPSTRLAGMAGASLPGGHGWTTVPLAALRGEPAAALSPGLGASHAA